MVMSSHHKGQNHYLLIADESFENILEQQYQIKIIFMKKLRAD
jgi:hypothetical protein